MNELGPDLESDPFTTATCWDTNGDSLEAERGGLQPELDVTGCVSPERNRWPAVRRGQRFTTGTEIGLSGSVVLTRWQ